MIPGAQPAMQDEQFLDEYDEENDPYCMCDEQPIEAEEASGHCFACGKPLL